LRKHQTFAKEKIFIHDKSDIGHHQKLNYNRKAICAEVNFHVSCWSTPGT